MNQIELREELNKLVAEYRELKADLGHYNKRYAWAKKHGFEQNIEWYSECRRLTMSVMNGTRAKLKKVMVQLTQAVYGVKHPSMIARQSSGPRFATYDDNLHLSA